MTNVAPRWTPAVPWLSAFPELNVRAYVRVNDKPGVYFFSLDAGSALAVRAARALFNLPYFTASMHLGLEAGVIRYESRRLDTRAAVEFAASYSAVGSPFQASAGTLDYFLTERYCLYNVDRKGRPYRLDIHHPPWNLQSARAAIDRNTMTEAAGLTRPSGAPLVHFSKRQDMVGWGPAILSGTLDG
jgi:uncharacterized protein YqjF (DUF2071 family)